MQVNPVDRPARVKDTIFPGKSKRINFIPPLSTNPLFKTLSNAYIPHEIEIETIDRVPEKITLNPSAKDRE
jgi:hypothetical protein